MSYSIWSHSLHPTQAELNSPRSTELKGSVKLVFLFPMLSFTSFTSGACLKKSVENHKISFELL